MKQSLLLLGIAAAAMAASTPEQEVRAALQQFNEAAKAGNEAVLNRLLADELVYVHSTAKIENKSECVAALVKTKPVFEMAPGYHVRVYGNTAVLHASMTAGGTTKLDVLQVWVKGGGSWRMVARHTARQP